MSEWSNVRVLKTLGPYGPAGSNPAASAKIENNMIQFEYFESPLAIANAFNYIPEFANTEIISIVDRGTDGYNKPYVVFYKKLT